MNAGPFRLYESGSAGAFTTNIYYADFMDIPNHPEYDGQFFNCVTEVRDINGYEWLPSADVNASISACALVSLSIST